MKKTNKIALINGLGATKKRAVYTDADGNEYITFRQTLMLISDLCALDIRIIEKER